MNFEIVLTYPPTDDGNGFGWYNGGGSDLTGSIVAGWTVCCVGTCIYNNTSWMCLIKNIPESMENVSNILKIINY